MSPRDEAITRYDEEVRARPQTDDPRFVHEWDGPVYRVTGPGPAVEENAVLLTRFDDVAAADAAIARQLDHFGRLGHAFEWKLYAHDRPPDLADRLARAGLRPEPVETLAVVDLVEVGALGPLRPELRALPPGVELVRLDHPEALAPLVALNELVYGQPDHARWLVESLAAELRSCPEAIVIHGVRAGKELVAAGWARLPSGSAFGSLWGGLTAPAWRGRGLYSALVAARAHEARRRGRRWLAVDCGPLSLPILERLGFERLSTTTPWIAEPPRSR